ncbi:hypothetical protein KQI84_06270 [bacterium]|nr:hypothetical protein [bacterium]
MSINTRTNSSSGASAAAIILALWALGGLVVWLVLGWVWTTDDLGPIVPPGIDPTWPVEQLRAVGAFLALNLAAFGWGALVLSLLRVPRPAPPIIRLAVALSIGHIVVAALTFCAGIVHLLPWGLLILAVGFVGVGLEWKTRRPCNCARPSAWTIAWLVLAAIPLLISFLAALAPVVESDGLRYHLFGPQEYLKAGAIVALPYHAFTNLPFQTNMLFMAAMSFGGERAAQLMHWTYLPLIMIFGGALADRLSRALGRKYSPVPAGVLAGLAPVMTVIAGWPFVDLSTAAFLLAATWALCPGSLRRQDHRLVVSGLFAGAAIGTKLTAIVPATFLGLVVLGILVTRPRKPWRLALFVLPIALVPSPWFVKSAVIHHNPVYPAGYGVFGGPEWDADTDAFYKAKAAEKGFGKGPMDLVRSPWDITTAWKATPERPGFEDQNPGPMGLALLPAALVALGIGIWRRRTSIAVWLIGTQLIGGWLFWFATYQSVRFLLVPLALIAVAGSVALMILGDRFRPLMQSLLLALGISAAAWQGTYILAVAPTRPAVAGIGLVDEESFLSAVLNFYDAVAWLNVEAEPGEKVYYIGEHRGLYAEYPAILSDWFDKPRVLVDIRTTPNNDAMLAQWREEGVRYVLFNFAELRMYEQAYFRPRFTDAEWTRYEDLIHRLMQGVVFSPRDNVFVIDLKAVQ